MFDGASMKIYLGKTFPKAYQGGAWAIQMEAREGKSLIVPLDQ